MYNDEGCLVLIDARASTLPAGGMVRLMKDIVPVGISKLEERFKENPALMLVESEFDVSLDDFNREYPYKRNSHLLPPIWQKMGISDRIMAWKAAGDYRRYCERNSQWYKPKIAAAWLKDKEYLNDWKIL